MYFARKSKRVIARQGDLLEAGLRSGPLELQARCLTNQCRDKTLSRNHPALGRVLMPPCTRRDSAQICLGVYKTASGVEARKPYIRGRIAVHAFVACDFSDERALAPRTLRTAQATQTKAFTFSLASISMEPFHEYVVGSTGMTGQNRALMMYPGFHIDKRSVVER